MSEDLTTVRKTHATATFELRREIRRLALASQESEHVFYQNRRKSTESDMRGLCAELLRLLNEVVAPDGEHKQVLTSLVSAGVGFSSLHNWALARDSFGTAARSAVAASEAVKQCEVNKDDLEEGMFFKTPKTGCESRLADTVKALAAAVVVRNSANDAFQTASVALDAAADVLLRDMLTHASAIANTPVGSRLKAFLAVRTETRESAGQEFVSKQLELAAAMRSTADRLHNMYAE